MPGCPTSDTISLEVVLFSKQKQRMHAGFGRRGSGAQAQLRALVGGLPMGWMTVGVAPRSHVLASDCAARPPAQVQRGGRHQGGVQGRGGGR